MEPHIKKIFTEEIKNKALMAFGINIDDCSILDGFESFVYKVVKKQNDYILKISHDSRRSEDLIMGEVDFINYLSDNGLNIPRAVDSENGNLVETFNAEKGEFTAILFEYAKGDLITSEDKTDKLYMNMGQYLGKLHFLSRNYVPKKIMRPDIFQETIPLFDFIPREQKLVRQRADSLIGDIKSFKMDKESYGMIHVDFHSGNFHINNGNIALFDFDDCQYSWFIHDIAMAFFYMLPHHIGTEQQINSGYHFLNNFLKGYGRENKLDNYWLSKIGTFLKLREIELYAIIHRSFDLQDLDPWCSSFMKDRKEKIESNIPYFPLKHKEIEI